MSESKEDEDRKEKNRARYRAEYLANRDKKIESAKRYNRRNKASVLARQAERRKADPEKARRQYRAYSMARYGITLVQYDEMLKAQEGGCALCGQENENGRRLSVDHAHADGSVRGLLCNACNFVLGHSGDDPELLERAAEYLRGRQVIPLKRASKPPTNAVMATVRWRAPRAGWKEIRVVRVSVDACKVEGETRNAPRWALDAAYAAGEPLAVKWKRCRAMGNRDGA